MIKKIIFFCLCILSIPGFSQELSDQLDNLKLQKREHEKKGTQIDRQIEQFELELGKRALRPFLPALLDGEILIDHSLMYLVYSETHEQAKWVAHLISPKIIKGQVGRTNDFRKDPKVTTGTAIEQDYFLKELQADSTYKYDGFGYDRGHLAPSADFRWSSIALSESYFYSNMSPQTPEFNRGIWADLENALRTYIFNHPDTELYVFTGPVLSTDLPSIERSINKVSIPKFYWKVALDLKNKRMIGFVLPNVASEKPLNSFIRTVDDIEGLTGIDFAPYLDDTLEEQLEQQKNALAWLGEELANEVLPIDATTLPKNHFNTIQSKRFMGSNEEVSVCGTVVDARLSRSKNALMNLDKKYPNQVFTIFIRKENIINFAQDPVKYWINKKVCATGKVVSLSGTPAIFLDHEHQLKEY